MGERSPESTRIAVGVDVVEVARIARLLGRYPTAEGRLFSEGERAYCAGRRRADEHFAARFAAKEAVFKALGCGMGDGVRWRDVEVVNEPGGRPRVRLSGHAASLAERQGVAELDISLSHSAGIAIAEAVAVVRAP